MFRSFMGYCHYQIEDLHKTPDEIEEEFNSLLRGKRRKHSHESTQGSQQKLNKKVTETEQTITTTDLMNVRWGSIIHAARFLRKAAMVDSNLTTDYFVEGFRRINKLVQGSSINYTSYNLLLTSLSTEELKTFFKGFGARSFFLEDTRERSYWLSFFHWLVAFNMGYMLHGLQVHAYTLAERRIARPQPNEVIQISSTKSKARNIPIVECPFPIVHKQEWTKLRNELGRKSHQEYIRSGGSQHYPDYIKQTFQISVKQALTASVLVQSFGILPLLWDALSPSCMYKLCHADLRAASVEQDEWSQANKMLWRLTKVNPFEEFEMVEEDLASLFLGRAPEPV